MQRKSKAQRAREEAESALKGVAGLVIDYMHGPHGEPRLAEAHDYLCHIRWALDVRGYCTKSDGEAALARDGEAC